MSVARENRLLVAQALILLFATMILSSASLEITREVVGCVSDQFQCRSGTLVSTLPLQTAVAKLMTLSVVLVFVPLLTVSCAFLRDDCFERLSFLVVRKMRLDLFDHIVHLRYREIVTTDQGLLTKRLLSDTDRMRSFVADGVLRPVADVVLIVGIVLYLFWVDRALAAVTLGCVLAMMGAAHASGLIARRVLRSAEASHDHLTTRVAEAFSRLSDIKHISSERLECRRFRERHTADEWVARSAMRYLLFDRHLLGLSKALLPIAILLAGAWAVAFHRIGLDSAIVMIAATSLVYGPLEGISTIPIIYQRGTVIADNVMTLLSAPREDFAAKPAVSIEERPHCADASDLLRIRNLKFRYDDETPELVVDDLRIRPGQRVAILGRSGAGKSTLGRLIFGLLGPYEGCIALNGDDIRSIGLADLRARIKLMPQDAQLISGTILDNLCHANDMAEPSRRDAMAAAVRAGLADDLAVLTTGLDAPVESLGKNLSIGQRKRIAIARVLLNKPDLVILDEPFSGVSPKDRDSIAAGICSISREAAVIIITHETTLLSECDLVVELRREGDQGGIGRVRIHVLQGGPTPAEAEKTEPRP